MKLLVDYRLWNSGSTLNSNMQTYYKYLVFCSSHILLPLLQCTYFLSNLINDEPMLFLFMLEVDYYSADFTAVTATAVVAVYVRRWRRLMSAVGGGSFEVVMVAHFEVVVADCLLESGNQKYVIILKKYRVSNCCFIFTYFDKNFS